MRYLNNDATTHTSDPRAFPRAARSSRIFRKVPKGIEKPGPIRGLVTCIVLTPPLGCTGEIPPGEKPSAAKLRARAKMGTKTNY